MAPTISYEI